MATVCVQGNIGAGKSTVLAALGRDATVVPEQVAAWGPRLELFYAGMAAEGRNTRSWGFHLQILLTFARARRAAPPQDLTVFERSPSCSRQIFVQLAHAHGDIDAHELALYEELYEDLGWEPEYHVYLRCTPEVALARTRARARKGEAAITLEYLRVLHELHERVYNPNNFTNLIYVVLICILMYINVD